MADEVRHDQSGKSDERRAPDKLHDEQDDLSRRREHAAEKPALTPREREERWPIG